MEHSLRADSIIVNEECLEILSFNQFEVLPLVFADDCRLDMNLSSDCCVFLKRCFDRVDDELRIEALSDFRSQLNGPS